MQSQTEEHVCDTGRWGEGGGGRTEDMTILVLMKKGKRPTDFTEAQKTHTGTGGGLKPLWVPGPA